MENGSLPKYLKRHPKANKRLLVSVELEVWSIYSLADDQYSIVVVPDRVGRRVP